MTTRGPQAFVAAGIGIATDVGYLAIITREGDLGSSRVWFVAGFVAALSAAAIVGRVAADERAQVASLTAATCGFVSLGYLAIFSVGLSLLVAGALSGWALLRIKVRMPQSTANALAAAATVTVLATIYVGFAATG